MSNKLTDKYRTMKISGKKLPAEKKVDPNDCNYGLFIRMSHERSVMNGSVERHIEKIKGESKKQGIKLIEKYTYKLEAVSGKSIINHPYVVQMLADLQANRIQGIVFTKLARFCRNMNELKYFSELFKQNGWQFRSLSENIDTSSLQGRMFFDIVALFAEWERETISERVAESIAPRAKQGSNLGGKPKYGFEWISKEENNRKIWTIRYNREEEKVIRFIVETFLKERNYRRTAKIVSQTYLTRNKNKWSDSRVFEILTNPIYRGDWIRNMRTCGDDNSVYIKPECEWVELEGFFSNPLISPSKARAIDSIIEMIKLGHKPISVPTKYLLTQIKCECGAKVNGRKYVRGGTYYKCQSCKNKIAVDEMDQQVIANLESLIESPDALNRIYKQVDEYCTTYNKLKIEYGKLKNEFAGIQQEILKQNKKYDEGLVDKESFRLIMIKLEGDRNGVKKRMIEIEDLLVHEVRREQVESYLRNLKDIQVALNSKDTYEKRQLISIMLPSILLKEDEIELSVAYLPTIPSLSKTVVSERNYVIPSALDSAETVQHMGRGSKQQPA